MGDKRVKVRLLFADDGEFHDEHVHLPAASLEKHERLVDALMEDPKILRQLHVDFERLVSAQVVDD
jgi:hypothetical protein